MRLTDTIQERYASGEWIGCYVDAEGTPGIYRRLARYERDQFMAEAVRPKAEDHIAPELVGKGAGKRACHWRFLMGLDDMAMTGSQTYPNCTAWAGRGVVGNCLATDKVLKSEPHKYPARVGTAVPYSFRGDMGAGMSPWKCAQVFRDRGVQLMLTYCDGKYDFTKVTDDEYYGNKWGRNGAPSDLLAEIKGNHIETISEIGDSQAVMDVLWAGFFIHCGSSHTSSSQGDPIGSCRNKANHSEALIGYDDTDEFREWYEKVTGKKITGAVGIWDQSWGDWNHLSNYPPFWPKRSNGMFVLSWKDTMWKINQTGIVYSNFIGFPMPTLPDWGTDQWIG